MQECVNFKKGQLVKLVAGEDNDFPAIMVYDFKKNHLNYVMSEFMSLPAIGIIVEDYSYFSKEYSDEGNSDFDNFKISLKNTLKTYSDSNYNDPLRKFEKTRSYLAEHFSWVYIDNNCYFVSKENLKAI